MKVLIISTLLVAAVVCEAPAPYPASGWRPSGPAFELPQKTPQKQYLPPLDPRNPTPGQYGPPEVDVSVQGLPTDEQLPIFQVSPVNGQQYVGPAFNSDIRGLNQGLQQTQIQQQTYRQFARQKQLQAEATSPQTPSPSRPRQNQPIPRQFVQKTTPKLTSTTPEPSTTTSTEPYSLNQGEILESDSESSQKTVEISKQKIQEFPPEVLLSTLAQLNLQSQYSPLQLGQIRAPVFFQPASGVSQKQLARYDAETHLAALPSVLAQQQLAQQQLAQQQLAQQQLAQQQLAQQQLAQQQLVQQQLVQQQIAESQFQVQPQLVTPNQVQYLVPNQENVQEQEVLNYQPQPQAQYPIQAQAFQPQVPPPQTQSNYDQENLYYPNQQQFLVQQSYQPQIPQQALTPAQIYQQQVLQNQLFQSQGQEGLQSGYDVNQQGNGVENEEKEEEDDEGVTVTAVATAFGTRTQPRLPNTYGAPAPDTQQDPRKTTTEPQDEEETTPTPRRKSAKLRNRRVRPVFTLDKTGHLVLVQDM